MRTRQFITVLILGVILRVWWCYTSVPFVDEHAHASYIMYIQEYWELPNYAISCEVSKNYHSVDSSISSLVVGIPDKATALLGPAPFSYENYQPPGYYILAALLDPYCANGLRLVSVFMFIVAMCFLWRTIKDKKLIYMLLFVPGIIGVTSMVGNDVYLFLGSCLLLWACTKHKLWMLVVAGVVLSTAKFHAIPMLFVVSAYYGYKRQWSWAMIALMFFAVAVGITCWRWPLSTVNGMGFVIPTFENMWHGIGLTIGTGIIDTDKGRWSGFLLALAMPLAIYIFYSAHRRMAHLPALNKLIIAAVFGVWLAFSLTHIHWLGRLLYAAIPWFAIPNKGVPNETHLQGDAGTNCGRRPHRWSGFGLH